VFHRQASSERCDLACNELMQLSNQHSPMPPLYHVFKLLVNPELNPGPSL
jgi:hypothetical protein